MPKHGQLPAALTLAGSDSGCGAGIQADLKTFAALGVHGTTALTCITAQNPQEVSGVQAIPIQMVRMQLESIVKGFPVTAAKTGMLYSKAVIDLASDFFGSRPPIQLVVDPVMVSTSGSVLLKKDAVLRLEKRLFPLAALITPNLDEASILLKEKVDSVDALYPAAVRLYEKYGRPVLLKGGHLRGLKEAADVFVDGKNELLLTAPYISKVHTHGTGCTYSAAITAFLARGFSLEKSVTHAKRYITGAIKSSSRVGDQWVLDWFRNCKLKKV